MNENLHPIVEGLAEERRRLLEELRDAPSGMIWSERHSSLADRAIKAVYADVVQQFPEAPAIAVIATGGYGRQELSPYSDIDITVAPLDESSKYVDPFVRQLYQGIHAVFETGLKMRVGYAYRLISDAPGLDATIRSGLLDARLIVGNRQVAKVLEDSLAACMPVGEFLVAKIEERDANFARFNATPLAAEPQLKEGAGGLRCFHCANWMRAAIGERPSKPGVAYDQVLLIRNLLHVVAGKVLDQLTRSRQAEVAEVLGCDWYDMMRDLSAAQLELHKDYLRTKEKVLESRFRLSPGITALRGEARIAPPVDGGGAAIGIAIATYLGLRIDEGETVPIQGVSGSDFMFAITKGEATLRNLDRCGLLDAVLPELTACRTLMPRDTAHDFSVFEHTLLVIRNIFNIDPVTALGAIRSGINNLGVLILAALLHDIGKLESEADHCEIGSKKALEICARWGLSEDLADLTSWLIAEHLTMSRFIHLRDIMNPQTIEDFAALVGDQERLDLLTLLTFADISAVSASAWTPALEAYLMELYSRTTTRLAGDDPGDVSVDLARRRLMRDLKDQDVQEDEVQEFVSSLPATYLASTSPETMRVQFQFAQRARQGAPSVDVVNLPELAATDVTICVLDRPGLLSQALGVFYALDLSLLALRASTTDTDPAVALDIFTVSFGGRPVPAASARQLVREMEAILNGRSVDDLMKERGIDTERRHLQFKYTYVSGNPGILEIQAPRGRGMAYRFSRMISEQGWNVHSARVGQWAGSAAAAFYISGPGHTELYREQVEAALTTLA